MAVFSRILQDNRGGIGVTVLAGVLCVAACLHTAAYWLRQEAEETQQRLLRRQLQFAVQALAGADFMDSAVPHGGFNLPPQKLYPGAYDLIAAIKAEEQNGITRYTISAEAGGETFALQQLKLKLPADIIGLGSSYTLAAGKNISGAENLPEGVNNAANMGDILDSIDVKNYAAFKELDFPSKTSFEEIGRAHV